ncbi:hypothetical protein SprV_0501989900 [Sparganum proliferum]
MPRRARAKRRKLAASPPSLGAKIVTEDIADCRRLDQADGWCAVSSVHWFEGDSYTMSSSRTSTPSNKDAQSYVSRILLPTEPLRLVSTNSPSRNTPLRTSSPTPISPSPWVLSRLAAASPRGRSGTPPSLFNFKSPVRSPICSPANRGLRVGSSTSTHSRLGYLPRVTDLTMEPTSMMERALRILESKKRPLNSLSDETENLPLPADGLATSKRRCASTSTSTVQQNNSHQTGLPDVANLGVNGTPEYFKCTSLVDMKRASRRSSGSHSDLASEPGRPDVVVSTRRNRPIVKPLSSSILPNRVSCLPSAELEALAFGSRKRPRAESPHSSSTTTSAATELLDSILGTNTASPAAPAAKRITREIPTQTEDGSASQPQLTSVAVSAVTTPSIATGTSFSPPPIAIQPLRHVSSVSKFIAGLEARARASALARSRSRQARSLAGQIDTSGSPMSSSLEARHDRIRKLFASLAEVPSTVTVASSTVSSSSPSAATVTATTESSYSTTVPTTASAPSVPAFVFGKEQSQKTTESLDSAGKTASFSPPAAAAAATVPSWPKTDVGSAVKPELPAFAGLPAASSAVQSNGPTSTAGFTIGSSRMTVGQTAASTTSSFAVSGNSSLPSSTPTICSTAGTASTASPVTSTVGASPAAPLVNSASMPSFNFGAKSSSSSASTTSAPAFNFGRVEAVSTTSSPATTTPLLSVFGSASKTSVTSTPAAAPASSPQLTATSTTAAGVSSSPAPTLTLFQQPKPSTTGLTTTVAPSLGSLTSTASSLFPSSTFPSVAATKPFSFGLKGTTAATTTSASATVPPASTTGAPPLAASTLFNFGTKSTAPAATAPALPGFSFVTASSSASKTPVFGPGTTSSSALTAPAAIAVTTTAATTTVSSLFGTSAATKPTAFGALTPASSGTSLSAGNPITSSTPSVGFSFTLPSATAASRTTSIFAPTMFTTTSSTAASTPTLFASLATTQNAVSMAATSTAPSLPSTKPGSTFLFGVTPSTSATTAAATSGSVFGVAGTTAPKFSFGATSTTAPGFNSSPFGSPVVSTTATATTTTAVSTGGFAFAAAAGAASIAPSLFGSPAVNSFSAGTPSLFGQSPGAFSSSATLFAPSKVSTATPTATTTNVGLSFGSAGLTAAAPSFGDKSAATTGPVVSSNGFTFGASTTANSAAAAAALPATTGGFAFNFKAVTATTTSSASAPLSLFTSPKSSPANLFAAGTPTQPSTVAPGPFGMTAKTTAGPTFNFGSTATSAVTTTSNMVFGGSSGFGSSSDALKRTASSAFDAASTTTTTTTGPFGSALTFGAAAAASSAQPSAPKSVAFGGSVFGGATSTGQPFNFAAAAPATSAPSNGFNFMAASATSGQNAFGSPAAGTFVFGQTAPPVFGAQPGVGGSPPNPFNANPSPTAAASLHRRRQLRLKGRR